ncbi:DUF2750 domain-containing protein [Sphingobacterium puteale]|uniref:DUF2750 domain-containing protein n=1 Tax=Sphingobacterium puteale TaxID=2420510 RepID=A0A420VZ90_9SPHI|nr:DUF2750 domain-containing protein [Sphingobacterium puteale]
MSAVKQWPDYSPKAITLVGFKNDVIELIEQNTCLIHVFSVDSKAGLVVNLKEFARDMSDEFGKILNITCF